MTVRGISLPSYNSHSIFSLVSTQIISISKYLEEIDISLSVTDVSCFGYSDGNVTYSISGGIPPYSIDWGGFDPNNLPAGLYSVTVIDSIGCVGDATFIVSEPNSL